mmetsp:Transcript_45519/g.120254  ORF Transcript_45519/g.120254 Transcript_45519/m.120254 type:complete len:293 (-) Transcript_45519:133-1011(-)
MKAVGWSCTLSMSMRLAPRDLPNLMPSPLAKEPFVVGTPTRSGRYCCIRLPSEWSKPKPPVVRMTASARSSTSAPDSSWYSTPSTSVRIQPSPSVCCWMSFFTVHEVRISMPSLLAAAPRACCMMVQPTGTGLPSSRGGTRCVRFREWPPSCESAVSGTPSSSMSQWIASALFSESAVTQPRSLVPPLALTWVSRSKKRPSSSTPCCFCTRVLHALMPLVALAELPPRSASFSSMVTLAPNLRASMAALTPARPPPTTTTWAPSWRVRRCSRCSGLSTPGSIRRTTRGPLRE